VFNFAILFGKSFQKTHNFKVLQRMDTLSYKTISANSSTVAKDWVIIDAQSAVLGRLASEVARIIRGKHKPNFTPHVDCGDNVIVINADKIKLTGKKWTDRELISHTGYPGGQRRISPRQLKEKSASLLVERAVRGMLPKNRLGRALFGNLYVYNGSEHPHAAQQPKEIKITWK
jgi:large subunit ribosomal protein L13